ncbi:MAG TPA: Uma2 family endonuclease, partial [Spirochaetes bacterium]|nr:Uma2 family endonuclease [Spirochaetota bacterium]
MKIDYIPRYTYEDYVNWEGRWELIDGLPYAMSPLPSINHQQVNG